MSEKHDDIGVAPATARRIDGVAYWLETIVAWVEAIVAVVLTFVIVVAVAAVAIAAVSLMGSFSDASISSAIFKVVKAVLDTFIVIELFRITVAYVRHREVVPVVLETALVVAAREIVVIEAGANEPLAAAAVGGTLLAIGLTSFLLARAGHTTH